MAATGSFNHTPLLQKQKSFGANNISKPDESVLVEGSNINNSTKYKVKITVYVCYK